MSTVITPFPLSGLGVFFCLTGRGSLHLVFLNRLIRLFDVVPELRQTLNPRQERRALHDKNGIG